MLARSLLSTLIALYCFNGAHGTTLFVSYDSVNGATIGIDSAVTTATLTEFQRNHSGTVTAECKIQKCGRYLIASSGYDVTSGNDVALICSDLAKGTYDRETILKALESRAMALAQKHLGELLRQGQEPGYEEELFTIVIAGSENGKPILTVDKVLYRGRNGNSARLVAGTQRCPENTCAPFTDVSGAYRAINISKQNGTYPKETDPLHLAEALINIEIADHSVDKLVMGPISVVQIKNVQPIWFSGGLCQSVAPTTEQIVVWSIYLGVAMLLCLPFVVLWRRQRAATKKS